MKDPTFKIKPKSSFAVVEVVEEEILFLSVCSLLVIDEMGVRLVRPVTY
jgi:hypothetical protein